MCFSALIGGTTEDESSFLSKNTLYVIFEEVHRKLLNFIGDSNFIWIKHVSSSLGFKGKQFNLRSESSVDVLEMAQFALEVLSGCLFSTKVLSDECEIIQGIIAVLFVIGWEYNCITSVANSEVGEELERKNKLRMSFCESVCASRNKIHNQLIRSLSSNSRVILGTILVQSVRCAALEEDILDTDKITTLCCLWLLEIMEYLCPDHFEEQKLLDEFLSSSDQWPSWVMPVSSFRERSAVLRTDNSSINVSEFCLVALFSFLLFFS